MVNFNIGVNRPLNANHELKHWVYYPEKNYPFYRIGFPANLSAAMAPRGCGSLYGEFSYLGKSKRHINQLLQQSRQLTKKLFAFDYRDILTEKVINIDHAYVIYNKWRDTHLPSLIAALEKRAVYSIGRYGAWKYSSMQDAVLDGKACAAQLLKQV